MNKRVKKLIEIIEICTKEIEENYNKELFIMDFWTGEVLDAANELKMILNQDTLDD